MIFRNSSLAKNGESKENFTRMHKQSYRIDTFSTELQPLGAGGSRAHVDADAGARAREVQVRHQGRGETRPG